MEECFLTLGFTQTVWDKLIKVAAFESRDDLEKFVAELLRAAIEERDNLRKAELYSSVEVEIEVLREVYKRRHEAKLKDKQVTENTGDLDDGILF